MRASFLVIVTRGPGGPACTPLATSGACAAARPWDTGPGRFPREPGFYVFDWDHARPAAFPCRPAVASDFERFGFPCPGGFAVGSLRRIEAEARQGIRATIPLNPARPHLQAIRAEAARGLAMEGVGAGEGTGGREKQKEEVA